MTEETEAPVEGQAEATPEQAAPQASWTTGLPDDLRGYVETKGFKDTAALAESYRNLEKLRGVPQDRLLTLPEDMTKEGALDAVFSRLGRPETADKYSNTIGEALTDDTYKAAAAEAHKLGLTDSQFAGMQTWLKNTMTGLDAARREEIDATFSDWREQNPQRFEAAKRLMAAAGVDDKTVDRMLQGDTSVLFDTFGKLGARMGERPIVAGDGDPELGMSPAAAKARIAQLFSDKTFMDVYTNSNPAVRQPAIARMTKLQEIAAKAGA